jgi:hypothetical protein
MGFQVLVAVMAGQKREARLRADVQAIHVFNSWNRQDVDARDKPGHDEMSWLRCHGNARSNKSLTSSEPRSTAPYMLA